jgi:hypothetical protein
MRLSPCPLTLKQLQIGLLRLSVRWRQWLQSQPSCTLGGHCITPCLRHMCSYWEFHTSRLPIYGSTAQYLAWLSSHCTCWILQWLLSVTFRPSMNIHFLLHHSSGYGRLAHQLRRWFRRATHLAMASTLKQSRFFLLSSTLRRRHPSYIFGVRITVSFFSELLGTLHELPQSMRMLMIVTTINWVAWFPLFCLALAVNKIDYFILWFSV